MGSGMEERELEVWVVCVCRGGGGGGGTMQLMKWMYINTIPFVKLCKQSCLKIFYNKSR